MRQHQTTKTKTNHKQNKPQQTKHKKLIRIITKHTITKTTKTNMTTEKSDLCIPKINSNVSKQFIVDTLQKANLGQLERFTELPLKHNPLYKRILFTVKWEVDKPKTIQYKKMIENNQTLKLVPNRNDPQFWIIVPSCCPKPSSTQQT